MPAPVFQAVGAQQNSATASQNVSWPTHQTNDIGLMVIETSGGGTTLTPPTGWAAIPGTPVVDVATAAGSKLHVWWKRAASSAEAAVATGFGTSDHVVSRIYTFRGCITTGNPWDVTTTGTKTTTSTTATVPAVTTTVDESLVVMIVGRPDDSTSTTHFGVPVNATLTGLAEAGEAGTNNGDGGGFVVSYGTDATPGSTGTSTLTKTASTTDTYVVLALRQPPRTLTLTTETGRFIAAKRSSRLSTQFISTTTAVNWTAGHQADDVGILMAYTSGTSTTPLSVAGYTYASSPIFIGSGDPYVVHILYKIATTSSETVQVSTLATHTIVRNADLSKLSSLTFTTSSASSGTFSCPTISSSAGALFFADFIVAIAGGGANANIQQITGEVINVEILTSQNLQTLGEGHQLTTSIAAASTLQNVKITAAGSPSTALYFSVPANQLTANLVYTPVAAAVLTAAKATFTLTGRVAQFPLFARPTGFTLTGRAANLNRGYRLIADKATFNDTFIDAGLLVGRRLTADKATFTLTGRAAQFPLFARRASFTLSGTATGLNFGRRLIADKATFTFTGRSAQFPLFARSAAYTLSGNSADLPRGLRLTASPAAFTLTGYNTALIKVGSYSLLASPQSYSLTGKDTALKRTYVFQADSRSYALTGIAAGLNKDVSLTAQQTSFALTGKDAVFPRGYRLTADTATFTLTGKAAQFPLYARSAKFFLPERNLRTWSESFDDASWTKAQTSIIANATTAPDGTPTADALIENTTQSVSHNINKSFTFVTNRTYTHSCYFKLYPGPITRHVRLQLGNAAVFGTDTYIRINLTTGTIGTTSGTPSATGITGVGNGWYRAWITKEYTGAGVTSTPSILLCNTSNAALYTDADGQSGAYLWGDQFEEGSLTAYDPTGPAAAGRTDLRIARKLTADTQSYTLTGKDATLTKTSLNAYTLTADTRSYALTGNAAGLTAARKLTADTTSFTLTGTAAALRRDYRLTAASSSYALTGNATGLLAGRRLTADVRSYALSGVATGFLRGIRFPAATGSYALTGFNAALVKTGSYSLLAGPQSYTLTGQATGLTAGRKLTAATGAFALTGNAAILVRGRTLGAESGAFAVTGQAVGLAHAYTLSAAPTAYTLAGTTTDLRAARKLTAATTAYAFTPRPAATLRFAVLPAATGPYLTTAFDAGTYAGRKLPTGKGEYTFTAQSVDLTPMYLRPIVILF